ncbi:hypothetical protein PLESTB_001054100 [Pleodorina starrii]|uniref:Uncharacterized protein n=1 Tax=Pleodorina starrii TaxID=330485 RepID=A0A9W6BPV4_9CHLO|nr:hypothetical protein PLESTM_001272400 [Pleodorina starrii]GLC56004.1 hypothetical protein PLESTB_001054100 [Pleodorina starrii]GLC63991.1 hypothetical protein PLESTF_000106600 [Pleodorina starrii]
MFLGEKMGDYCVQALGCFVMCACGSCWVSGGPPRVVVFSAGPARSCAAAAAVPAPAEMRALMVGAVFVWASSCSNSCGGGGGDKRGCGSCFPQRRVVGSAWTPCSADVRPPPQPQQALPCLHGRRHGEDGGVVGAPGARQVPPLRLA